MAAASASQLRYLADRLVDQVHSTALKSPFRRTPTTSTRSSSFGANATIRTIKPQGDCARLRYVVPSAQRNWCWISATFAWNSSTTSVSSTLRKKVRVNSGAAISSAIAGAMTAIFVANLNLRSFQGGHWAIAIQDRVNRIQEILLERQTEALRRASALQPPLGGDEQGLLFRDLD